MHDPMARSRRQSLFGNCSGAVRNLRSCVRCNLYVVHRCLAGWNVLEWDSARFGTFLSLLMGGLVFYVLLVTLARTILLLRHCASRWSKLATAGADALDFPRCAALGRYCRCRKICGESMIREDKQGAMEPHIIIRLKSGSNFEYQGLPLWRPGRSRCRLRARRTGSDATGHPAIVVRLTRGGLRQPRLTSGGGWPDSRQGDERMTTTAPQRPQSVIDIALRWR